MSAVGGKVDIDHVVALGQAWASGAQQLTEQERTWLANDPMNLMASDASANRQKGDKEASAWLPPNKSFRCEYVSRQIMVKSKYKLWSQKKRHDRGSEFVPKLIRCRGTASSVSNS